MLDLHRPGEALALAERAVAADPTDSEALCLLARCHAGLDHVDAAVEVAGRAAREAPDWSYPPYVAARALVLADRPRDALSHARRAVAIDPGSAQLQSTLALCLARCGLADPAMSAMDQAIELAPDDVRVRNDASYIALILRRWTTAEQHAEVALVLDPENATALNNLAAATRKRGRRSDALQLFAQAARIDPRSKAGHNARRLAGGRLGGLRRSAAPWPWRGRRDGP